MAKANRLSDQVPMKVALKEVLPTKFLPYSRHVNEEVIALDSGDMMLTFELQGRAFETSDVRDLNDWHSKLNGMLRNLHDDLKTYRKRNALMVFATQSPADALKSDISHSILEQVATKIMLPNPNGNRRDYIDGFSMTEAEYALIREELSPESRKFLVKQQHDSVVVELDLSGLDDELAVLSGRAETTAIATEVIAEYGRDPAVWLPIFHNRRRPS